MPPDGRSKRPKTTAPSTAVAKVPQAHGGALNQGGTPGNKGGRPPSAIRAAFRLSLAKRRSVLTKIADSDASSDSDRIRAVDTLGKYSDLSQPLTPASPEVLELLRRTVALIQSDLPPAQSEPLLAKMDKIWNAEAK